MRKIYKNVFLILALWFGLTYFIQSFKCPKLTQTELLIRTPNSFIMDWIKCK